MANILVLWLVFVLAYFLLAYKAAGGQIGALVWSAFSFLSTFYPTFSQPFSVSFHSVVAHLELP